MQYFTFLETITYPSGNQLNIRKKSSKKGFLTFLLFQLFVCSFCFSQSYPGLSTSDTITIHSKIFNSDRRVIITKSLKIKKDEGQSNCIVYMDAEDKNINGIVLQTANNLMIYEEIPQSYLVGIMHEDRNAELLEKKNLLKFLQEEVIPLLNEQYGISENMTIAGHSFGAYFATYAFLTDNARFTSCIAISPAYWPHKNDVLDLLKEKSLSGNFFLGIGDKRWDEISLRKGVFKARDILKDKRGLSFIFDDLKGFSHNATPAVGFGLGLSFIYDEWEWGNILSEQERRLKSSPDFWGHLEIKGDALFHLDRILQAKDTYKEALKKVSKDQYLSKKEVTTTKKRLNKKVKTCR